jgi:hypothetical protein
MKPVLESETTQWISAALARRGLEIAGAAEEVHRRIWSRVVRVPTGGGAVFFKAVAPALAYEAGLTRRLAEWRPDCTPAVLAADPARGWLLLGDGGLRLREALQAEGPQLRRWLELLPRYAELQIELSGRLDELRALGVPDRGPAALPDHLAGLLAEPAALSIDHPEGLSAAEAARLRALGPRLADLCAELQGCGVPLSLHHGDFHDGNIFLRGAGYIFFDWGDSSLAHPFFSLRTAFISVENGLDLPEGAPEFERLRDAYLEPWTRFAAPARLREAFALAQRLSALCSALSWSLALSAVPVGSAERAAYRAPVPALLQEFLANLA